jgi:hypothetical protein
MLLDALSPGWHRKLTATSDLHAAASMYFTCGGGRYYAGARATEPTSDTSRREAFGNSTEPLILSL